MWVIWKPINFPQTQASFVDRLAAATLAVACTRADSETVKVSIRVRVRVKASVRVWVKVRVWG